MWFVYILECVDGSYYTGICTDLDRRLAEHNSSARGAKYTRSRRPVKLVYSQIYQSRSQASRAEAGLKKWKHEQKRKFIQANKLNSSFQKKFMPSKKTQDNKKQQEFEVNGHEIVEKIKELIAEGNARRIIIKSEKGDKLLEVPVTIGAVGVLVAPVLAAVGALAALVTKCTIVVEKR